MRLTDVLEDLGHYIVYYPAMNKVTSALTATVFLSNMLQWQGFGKTDDGWVYKTQAEIEAETGLTRREQETARAILREKHILEEERKGVPARLFYRINTDILNDYWEGIDRPTNPDIAATNKDGGKRHTRMAENAILDVRETPSKNGVFRQSITTTTTQQQRNSNNNSPPIVPRDDEMENTEVSSQSTTSRQIPPAPSKGKNGGAVDATQQPPHVNSIAAFVQAYPKHRVSLTQKPEILAAWKRAIAKPTTPSIIALCLKLGEQRGSYDWTKDGGKWVPNIIKYLDDEKWNDPIFPYPETKYKTQADWNSGSNRRLVL